MRTRIISLLVIIFLLGVFCVPSHAEDVPVFEQDGIAIYMLGFSQDSHNRGQLKYKIENNRPNKCTIMLNDTYLNGKAVGAEKNILLVQSNDKITEKIDVDLEYLLFWEEEILKTVTLCFSVMDEEYDVILEAKVDFEIPGFVPVVAEASAVDIFLLDENGVKMTIMGYKKVGKDLILYYRYDNPTDTYAYLSHDYEISGSEGNFAFYLFPNLSLIGSEVLSLDKKDEIKLPSIMTIEINEKESNGYSGNALFPVK